MNTEITSLLGLTDYPFLANMITGIVFLFILYSLFMLINAILKRVGGWK